MSRSKHTKSKTAEVVGEFTKLIKVVPPKDRLAAIKWGMWLPILLALIFVAGGGFAYWLHFHSNRERAEEQQKFHQERETHVESSQGCINAGTINNSGTINNGPVTKRVDREIHIHLPGTGRPIGAFGHPKDVVAAAVESCLPDATAISILSQDFMKLAMETKCAFDRRDRANVIHHAAVTKASAERLMAFNVPFGDELKEALKGSAEASCESAWNRGEYQEMYDYAKRVVDICGIPPPVRFLAYMRLAELLIEKKNLYIPTIDELLKLKGLGKEDAYAYLNLFAKWGFLYPYKVDPYSHTVTDCSFEEYFGFDRDLEYRKPYQVVRFGANGERRTSNEVSFHSGGLWCCSAFDLTVAFDAVSGRISRNAIAIEFDSTRRFDEFDAMNFYNHIVVKDDGEENGEPGGQGLEVGWVPGMAVAMSSPVVEEENWFHNEEVEKMLKEHRLNGTMQPAPEPSSALLLILGVAGIALRRGRRV